MIQVCSRQKKAEDTHPKVRRAAAKKAKDRYVHGRTAQEKQKVAIEGVPRSSTK